MSAIWFLAGLAMTCAGASEERTEARRAKLRAMMEKQVIQYVSCKTDSDCTFFPEIEGFAVNWEGLPRVNRCAKELSRKIFPECFPSLISLKQKEFGMTVSPEQAPTAVLCQAGQCVSQTDKAAARRDWFAENSRYLSQPKAKRSRNLDPICEDLKSKADASK